MVYRTSLDMGNVFMLYAKRAPYRQRPRRMNRELAGTVGGFVATAPMTVAMMALHRALPHHEKEPLPPRQSSKTQRMRPVST